MQILFPFIGLILFILLWFGVVYVVGRFGWYQMAKNYETSLGRPVNAIRTSGTLHFMINYSGVLYLGSLEEGLHLSVVKLFSFGHQNLLVPWSEISDRGDFSLFFVKYRSIEISGVPIWLRDKIWKQVQID